jgi:hypothetical protein
MRDSRRLMEAQRPTFVFRGTVKKLEGATMSAVPVDRRTVVVRVDQIIEAPPDLAGYLGQNITVQLAGRQDVRVGEQMIFHTIGWMFGDSVAVRSLRQESAKSSRAAMLPAGDDPVARRAQRQIRERFDAADLVVSGRIIAVRLPKDAASQGYRVGAETHGPITEHEPKWREAILQVDEVLKGAPPGRRLVVRFPASSDVMWYGAPQLHAGKEGFFMLHRTEADPSEPSGAKPRKGKARTAGTAEAGSYRLLDAADVQPCDERDGFRAILEAASTKHKR